MSETKKPSEIIKEEIASLNIFEDMNNISSRAYRLSEDLNAMGEFIRKEQEKGVISSNNKDVDEFFEKLQEIDGLESEIANMNTHDNLIDELKEMGITFTGRVKDVHFDYAGLDSNVIQKYELDLYINGIHVSTTEETAEYWPSEKNTDVVDLRMISTKELMRIINWADQVLLASPVAKYTEEQKNRKIKKHLNQLDRLSWAKEVLQSTNSDSKVYSKLRAKVDELTERFNESYDLLTKFDSIKLNIANARNLLKTAEAQRQRKESWNRTLDHAKSEAQKLYIKATEEYSNYMGLKLMKIYKRNYKSLQMSKTLGAKGTFIKLIPESVAKNYFVQNFDKLYVQQAVYNDLVMTTSSLYIPLDLVKLCKLSKNLMTISQSSYYTNDKVGVLGEKLRKAFVTYLGDNAKQLDLNKEFAKLSDDRKQMLFGLYKVTKEAIASADKEKQDNNTRI